MDTDTSRLFSTDAADDRDQFIESLDQLSDEGFWNAARALAVQEPPLAATREYLECELSQHRCLLPLDALREVCLPPHNRGVQPLWEKSNMPRPYACLPALPWWARGLAAWHGEVICVVDLDAYLSAHLSESGQGERDDDYLSSGESVAQPGMLLVALHHAIPLGLHVRAIGQTRAVGADLARPTCPAPVWIDPARAALVAGMLGDAVILDLPALLDAVMGALNRVHTP